MRFSVTFYFSTNLVDADSYFGSKSGFENEFGQYDPKTII